MLEQPQLIGAAVAAFEREAAHRLQRRQILGAAQALDDDVVDDGHSTITTPGWSHSSWYSASSCSREVARTTQVTLR